MWWRRRGAVRRREGSDGAVSCAGRCGARGGVARGALSAAGRLCVFHNTFGRADAGVLVNCAGLVRLYAPYPAQFV